MPDDRFDYRKDEGRPGKKEPRAPSIPEPVKVPAHIHIIIRKIAKAKKISKHAAFREAIRDYAEANFYLTEGITLDDEDED